MTGYRKPDWAVGQTVRASGLVEDVCEHGVGHPNREWLERHPRLAEGGYGVHGCDGCCSRGEGRPGGAAGECRTDGLRTDPDQAIKRKRDELLRRVFRGSDE